MKIKNISKKVIGIGEVVVLPNEEVVVPKAYEKSVILDIYCENELITVLEAGKSGEETEEDEAQDNGEGSSENEGEALRQARLASLKGISEEDLGRLANELGINPAECKDAADMLKKVKATLKK